MGTEPQRPATPVRPRIGYKDADTPAIRKQNPTYHGSEYPVDASRNALLDDLGVTIPEVPFEFFKDNILPRLPANVDTAKTVAALKKAGHIDKKGRWKAFPADPCKCKDESATFNHLGDVVAAIIKCSGLGVKKLTVDYVSMPHTAPICDYVKKDNRPDAFMVFKAKSKSKSKTTAANGPAVYWRDICCLAEFKLKDNEKDLKDVGVSIVSALQFYVDSQ